jgi:hypothetical protein
MFTQNMNGFCVNLSVVKFEVTELFITLGVDQILDEAQVSLSGKNKRLYINIPRRSTSKSRNEISKCSIRGNKEKLYLSGKNKRLRYNEAKRGYISEKGIGV